MSSDIATLIVKQAEQYLAPVVSRVLGADAVVTGEVHASKIGRSAGTATAGIFHVSGRARTDSGTRPWSAVVKALGVPEVQRAWNEHDGMRELDVYRSEVFAHTSGGVRTPRCYGIQTVGELELIWLEDLSDAPQPPWQHNQFVESARHLGRFNAHWSQSSLPDWPWLNRQGFHASFSGKPSLQHTFERLPHRRDDPLFRAFAPGTGVDDLLRIWTQCDELLRRAESMPVGICHLDCHPKNLFPMHASDGSGYTIGIDWTEVGVSNLGIDLGHLLGSPISWLEVSQEQAWDLRDLMFDAYAAGLRDAGWSGNADRVRLTYLTRLACEALRNTKLVSNAMESEQWHELLESLLGHGMVDIAERWNKNRVFFVDCIEEALLLAKKLPYYSETGDTDMNRPNPQEKNS
jgi:hypothetical protein